MATSNIAELVDGIAAKVAESIASYKAISHGATPPNDKEQNLVVDSIERERRLVVRGYNMYQESRILRMLQSIIRAKGT